MRRWLRILSGCKFAARLSDENKGTLWSQTFSQLPNPALLDTFLDEAAKNNAAALVVFPHLRRVEEVAELLRTLCEGPRWEAKLAAWRKGNTREEHLVELTWRTPAGHLSHVMGLGPFGSMPVTRRAPFVGLTLWPGTHQNEHKPTRLHQDNLVGFIDMPSGIVDKEEHDRLWKETREACKVMLAEPPEGAALPEVAFCLDVDSDLLPTSCQTLTTPPPVSAS